MASPPVGLIVEAAGYRLSDAVRLAIMCGHAGRWMPHRLTTGEPISTAVYDRRADAALAARNVPDQCAVVKVPLGDLAPAAAQTWINVNRKLRAAGMDLIDPEREIGINAHARRRDLN